jgi:hypothetical protein
LRARLDSQPLSLSLSSAVCALALARSLTAVAMAANGTNILFPSSARHAKKRKILCTALVRRRWNRATAKRETPFPFHPLAWLHCWSMHFLSLFSERESYILSQVGKNTFVTPNNNDPLAQNISSLGSQNRIICGIRIISISDFEIYWKRKN